MEKGNIVILIGYLLMIIGFVATASSGYLITKGNDIKNRQVALKDRKHIEDKVDSSKKEIIDVNNAIHQTELNTILSFRQALEDKGIIDPEEISKALRNEYQVLTNRNANLSSLKGTEKEGGVAVQFIWQGWNNKKGFLFDIVRGLTKNRISVFIDEKGMLTCRVVTSDGRKEILSILDVRSWEQGKSYVIILQWITEQNKVEVYVNSKPFSISIPNLHFDKGFGNLFFSGTDFEGNYRGFETYVTPKDEEIVRKAMESIGLKEHRENGQEKK